MSLKYLINTAFFVSTLLFTQQSLACACCVNGPTFGTQKGMEEDYHSHHIDAINAVKSPPRFRLTSGEQGASEINLFSIVNAKLELTQSGAVQRWKLSLTGNIEGTSTNKSDIRTVQLQLTAQPRKHWTRTVLSQAPSKKTVGEPQTLEHIIEIPFTASIVSDPAKVMKPNVRVEGTLVYRGNGNSCGAEAQSFMVFLGFKLPAAQNAPSIEGERVVAALSGEGLVK